MSEESFHKIFKTLCRSSLRFLVSEEERKKKEKREKEKERKRKEK
ncbi:hypothetical protein ACMBCN_01595 [Candidatus Liberibacter asiaticus]